MESLKLDSPGWIFFVKASFACALLGMVGGVIMMPVDLWVRGYVVMGSLFLVGSSFTLAKTLRDQFEASKLINRLSQANVQPMVKELVGLYADPSNSHREITDALRHIIMTSCCNTTQVASTPAVWWRGAFADHVCFVVSLSLHASPCHPLLCCMLSW